MTGDLLDFLDEAQSPTIRKRDWMEDKKAVLVTPENIKECIDACIESGLYTLDLETTGLDNRVESTGSTRDKIAGVCLCADGVTGYYVPICHVEVKADGSREMRDCNVPWTVFEPEFRRLMVATDKGETRAIFHNGKFDQEFLQFNGGEPFLEWDKASCWEDTMLLAYLEDSRRRNKQLKKLTDKILGFDQVELKELYPEKHKGPWDFSTLDPTDPGVLWYGAGDGIFTFLLYKHLAPLVLDSETDGKTQKGIYSIEKATVAAVRWMERCRLHVDMDKVRELVRLGQEEWYESIMEVYDEASKLLGRDIMPGVAKVIKESFVWDDFDYLLPEQLDDAKTKAPSTYPDPTGLIESDGKKWPPIYDVNSPKQLGMMFDEMSVPGLKRTEKSGQVATGKAELDRIVEVAGEKFPFMAKIKRFREVSKALSSYLFPMLLDVDPSDNTMRINFRQDGTDTGRFSTPAKDAKRGKIIGFPQVNLQSVPSTYNPTRPACMNRLRECITPRKPNTYIVAIDFAGEELRLVTNLSMEPKWLSEFFHCASCDRTFPKGDGKSTPEPPPARCPNCGSDKIGDLHTLTALEIFGSDAPEKPEWKAIRGRAKCVHPDTIIWTDTGGRGPQPHPMAELPRGKEDTFHSVGGSILADNRSAPLAETYNGGVKELYHVVSRRGILTCSDAHKFVTAEGELVSIRDGSLRKGVTLKDPTPLCVGDGVFSDILCQPFHQVPPLWVKTNASLAYFAGLYQGDGTAGFSSIALCHGHVGKTDEMGVPYLEWQNALMEASREVGLSPVPRKKTVYLGSRMVLRWAASLGLVEGSHRTFRIPSWVWAAGREGLLQFLGGLIDTDGYVGMRDHTACICTKHYIFAGQIAEAARAVGLHPTIHLSWNKTYQRWYIVIGFKRNDSILLQDYVRHPGKNIRLRTEPVTSLTTPNLVKEIIPAGKMPCMDVHIRSGEHLYRANGVLTHNSTNFALSYGGGGSAVSRSTGVDKQEGWRIKRQFDRTYSGLRNWWTYQHNFAKTHGFVRTAFGRKYPVPDINNADRGFMEKAKRNSVNGPIQGSGADIMKMSMVFVYKEMKKRSWLDKCKLIATMHDELVFEIDGDILEEAIAVIVPIMTSNKFIMNMNWPIPFTCDVEIGADWTVPWDLNEMRFGEVRFIENKKYYKAEDLPEGYEWDKLPAWPAELIPYFKEARGLSSGPSSPTSGTAPAPPPSSSGGSSAPPITDGGSIGAGQQTTLPGPPAVDVGGSYTYRLTAPLTMATLINLSHVIHRCRNGGTRVLKLESRDGESLDAWLGHMGVEEFLVSHQQFYFLAQEYGL